MTIKICAAWLYAIDKFKEYDNFDVPLICKALETFADLGFDAVELEAIGNRPDLPIYVGKQQIKETAESLGLNIVNVCAVHPVLATPDWRAHRHLFAKTAELANYFGADMIQLDSHIPPIKIISDHPYKQSIKFGVNIKVQIEEGPGAFYWDAHYKEFVAAINFFNHIALDHGLKMSMEPRVGETISNSDSFLRLHDQIGNSDNFGVVLDCGHLHAQKEIIPLSVEKLNHRIMFVHASDNDGRDNLHLGCGRGTIDWEGTFRALRKYQFDGYWAVDIGMLPPEYDLDEETTNSIKFLREMAARL